ncbi:MAG: hypothetical protein D6800_06655 [Candidatus Zixiibacteriota bacterium]|nr:MAG: hypothetical protein D6800_06655 [candidate division Zixibacteria bacterium]
MSLQNLIGLEVEWTSAGRGGAQRCRGVVVSIIPPGKTNEDAYWEFRRANPDSFNYRPRPAFTPKSQKHWRALVVRKVHNDGVLRDGYYAVPVAKLTPV